MIEREDQQPDLEPAGTIERVGYRRPPVTTRFRPGQSGNPRGRPKGARNLSTVVAAALSERVAVHENGRRRRITKLEAAVKQLVNRAASGETRATQLLLTLVQANEARPAEQDGNRLGEADAIVMAELMRRMRESAVMTVLSEIQAALRSDFYSFMVRGFIELNPGAVFLPSWHIEVMAAKLQAVREGRIRRLIINIPPRHLKSLAGSIALPAWLLGHDPSKAIINVTYGQELSDKFARDCRAVMMTAWYRALFPTRLTSARAPVQELVTTQGGFRLATSVGGVLTGRGADIIIIDDPLKPSDAMSESRRVAANEWFDGTLYSRLNDKTRGAIVIIMQRLHEDDLVGHVLKQEGWEVVSFPAIAEADEEHVIVTPFRKTFIRRTGEALHPLRESPETLTRIRSTIGEYNFAGQYQQTPAPAGGGMVKEAWFRRYRLDERPASFDRIIQSWDTANKPSELSDYSVCTTWGVKGSNFYLLNVLRKKLDFPNLKRAVREQSDLFNPTVILIEDKASGTQLIQDLLDAGLSCVTRYKPDGDKMMRLHAQTATIENGFVHLPETAHWLADYLHELILFPAGRYDDQVDSTAQALAWMKIRRPGQGWIEYYKDLANQAT